MRLEILMTAVLFYGLAFLMGYAVRRLLKLKNEGILFSVLSGVMCMWALMELVLVPMTMKFASFTGFVYVWDGCGSSGCGSRTFLPEGYSGGCAGIGGRLEVFYHTGASGCAGVDYLPVMVSASSYVPGMG